MGPVLIQEETGVSGENLRCLIEWNWTIIFSHMTKVISTGRLHGAKLNSFTITFSQNAVVPR